jgi:PQQ-dependent catabolism-associated CXXCW motif protein
MLMGGGCVLTMITPFIDGFGARRPTRASFAAVAGGIAVASSRPRRAAARRAIAVALCLLFVAVSAPVEARRVALVIGNDTYKNVTPLKNARSDARAIAAVLKSVGFDVTVKEDVTDSALKAALRDFKDRVQGGDEVVFYFAGHGVQFAGTNYLVPVDIIAESEAQVADDAVPLQRVLDDLRDQRARFTLAIVDACRDNPFKGSGRAIGGRGLAPVHAAKGQMVVYSAEAGEAALDQLNPSDHNPNGVFTRVLVSKITLTGVPVDRIMKSVQSSVVQLAESAGHEQVPEIYDGSIGDFYFREGPAIDQAPPVPTPVVNIAPTNTAPTVHVPSAGELDEMFWARIRDSNDVEDFKDYDRRFPKGAHSAEAALMARRLSRVADPPRAQAPPAESPPSYASNTGGSYQGPSPGSYQSDTYGSNSDGRSSGSYQNSGSISAQQARQLDAMAPQERQDFGVPAMPQLHVGGMHGPTPSSIPGGRLITTKGVVSLVQDNRTPFILLDALGGDTTLPGAMPVAWASDSGLLGDRVEQNLGQMLYQTTRGNRDVALVFFCESNHCWMSYNAALRAIDLGYRNVLWYRGGLEAWTAAGLPTVAGGRNS